MFIFPFFFPCNAEFPSFIKLIQELFKNIILNSN